MYSGDLDTAPDWTNTSNYKSKKQIFELFEHLIFHQMIQL